MLSVAEKFAIAQKQYKPAIKSLAWKSYRQMQAMDVADVEQELLIVLYECVRTYDPDKGAKFNTYFTTMSRNRIIDLVRYHAAKRRACTYYSLSEEAVAAVADEVISRIPNEYGQSAEERYMNILEVQEHVAAHGTKDLMRIRARRKKAA